MIWGRLGRKAAVTGAFALSLTAAEPASAQSATPTGLEVSVIHATYRDGGALVDPSLRELSPAQLREEPFLRYNVYRLLERKRLGMELDRPVSDRLANGRTLSLTLLHVNGQGPHARYRLRAVIDQPKGKPVVVEVTASQGEPFFVAGPSYQGGALFIELAVVAPQSAR